MTTVSTPEPAAVPVPVLVLNCGSSSVKFAVVDALTGVRRITGIADRVGTSEAALVVEPGAPDAHPLDDPSYAGVIASILERLLSDDDGALAPVAVGHRVVHGGEAFPTSVIIDDDVVSTIADLGRLAPLHNPAAVEGIRATRAALPDVPQVAVFDTAFHQTIPTKAYRYAVPESWYRDLGVRRYGFHGTSVRWVAARAADLLVRPLADLRLAVAHLGNGCSVTAVQDGKSVDTSMGLTPLEGLVMGTRSGDVDPAVHAYVGGRTGAGLDEIVRQLNSESGLLGLSGVSADLRTVEAAVATGNEQARLALDVFAYRLARYVAGFVVPLGGLDALVFTGGIGENSSLMRSLVLAELGPLGLMEDPAANADNGRSTAGRITSADAPVALVVPTDEERLIAEDTATLAALMSPSSPDAAATSFDGRA